MNRLNDDCWIHIVSFLQDDHHVLFQLLLTCKQLLQYAVPIRYQRPFESESLAHDKKLILEDLLFNQLLLQSQDQRPVHLQSESPTPSQPLSIDYYSFIEEMHGYPINVYKSVADYERKRAHRLLFGPKIKKTFLTTAVFDFAEMTIGSLSQLQELTLRGSGPRQLKYLTVGSILNIHRDLYPGVLKKVTYIEFYDTRIVSSPKIMFLIRDIMDGQWSTDEITLNICSDVWGEDKYMLLLLQDQDLPQQLRFVEIIGHKDSEVELWAQLLKVFLSRCRQLERIQFVDYIPVSILSWALNESRETSSTNGLETQDRVQWKNVVFKCTKPIDLSFDHIANNLTRIDQAWIALVSGFGHCIEKLEFSVSPSEPEIKADLFPILSLPESVCLPKLQSLILQYPTFGRIAYQGKESLRVLKMTVCRVKTDGDGKWQDWKFLSGLEELYFDGHAKSMVSVDIFTPAEALSQQPQVTTTAATTLSSLLPKLKIVTIV